MKHNFKRFLSLVLAIVMVFSMFTGNIAYAAEEELDPQVTDVEPTGEGTDTPESQNSETPTNDSPQNEDSDGDLELTSEGDVTAVAKIDEDVKVTEPAPAAPTSTLTNCYTSDSTYWGECGGNASESFVFKFYNGDTYMGYTSLNNVGGIIDGDVYVSWNIKLDAASNTDEYWTMAWEIQPTLAMQPTRVEHWVDGVKAGECAVEPNWSDKIFPVVAAVADDNGKILSYVNGTSGHTLADAFAAGGNITLLRDVNLTSTLKVPADVSMTLDLNDKVIDGTEKCNIAIMSYGDLTIKDSSEAKTGTIKAGKHANDGSISGNTINICAGSFVFESGNIYSINNAILVDEQAATITINDGKITAEPTTNNSAVMYLSSTSETEISITGGEMVGNNGILLWNNTTINMTGGSIDAQGRLGIQGNGTYDNTEINISGDASVSGKEAAIYHPQGGKLTISDNAVLTGGSGIIVKGGKVTISGGTISATGEAKEYKPVNSGFVSTGDALYVEHYDNSPNSENYGTPVVTVTGGKFVSANGSAIGNYANTSNGVEALTEYVSGGIFSGEIPEALTAEGFVLEQNADGSYGVERSLAGKGTETEPYLINNVDDLIIFRDKVNAGTTFDNQFVKLTADINLNSEAWTPIGYMGKTFKGTFDGGNCTISNLKITKELANTAANNGIGLFGRTDDPAVIKNLTIENVDITGSLYVGAVVGYGYTGKSVENVTVTGNITIDAWWYAGVIGGNGYMNLVNNCHVIGDEGSYIKGNEGSYIGGIWGFRGEGNNKITNCSVKGLEIIGVDRVGGICGIGHYGNTISSCAAEDVTVTATDPNATTVGLIVGACQGTASEPTKFENNTLTDTTAQIVNGDGTYTEVENEYGSNIDGSEAVTNYAVKIGNKTYLTLEAAVAAAQAGDEIVLLNNVTLTSALTLPAGITLNGNGKQINGTITAGGDLTIAGKTTVTGFSAGYYNNTITIGEGASLKVTGDRMTVSYGNVFNITGSIADAKTADKTAITPSLELVGGITYNGNGSGVQFNATNAYIVLGDSTTKNNGATGEFYMNFTNCIVDYTKTLKTYMPTASGLAPKFNFNAKDSVVNFASHLELWLDGTTMTLDNTNMTVGGSFANAGVLNVENGSNFVVKAPIMSSHGGNTGTIAVKDASFELVDSNQDWENAGTMTAEGTGKLITNDFKNSGDGKVVLKSMESSFEGKKGITVTSEVEGYDVAYNESTHKYEFTKAPVAKIGEQKFESLEAAFKAATANCTIEILDDVTIDYNWDSRDTGAKFAVPVTIDGNNHTIKFTSTVDDKNYFAAFRFEADATVKNLTIDMSEATNTNNRIRAISAKGNLTVDGCTFIGNGSANNTRAIIFGEGAGTNTANLAISITNSDFAGWRRAISDNENGQDVKTVVVTGNTVNDASIYVSASESVTFTDNKVNGADVDIRSYSDVIDSVNVSGNELTGGATGMVKNVASYDNIQSEFSNDAPVSVTSGQTVKYFNSLSDAVAATQNGDTITLMSAITEGTVKLPATLKNVTFKGTESAVLKNMTIMASDGNAISYEGLTFDGICFENSRISLTGWRTGGAKITDLTVTNCTFKNLNDTSNSAPVHINVDAGEAVANFTFTNNVIDGATGGSKSGVYAQVTGKTVFTNNKINNVSFRPYVIQLTSDDGVADEFIVTGNTFSGSAVGRAQALTNNAEGTDTVNLVVSENIFKDITNAQQICYWNFNPETTTANLSRNYFDINILESPSKIYFNAPAANAEDLSEMCVYPYYADEAMTEEVTVPSIMVTYPVGNPTYAEGKIEYYENMLDAVPYTTNCPRLEGATITLLKDVSGAGMRFMENGMVFDLNGHTYTITQGTGSQGTNTSGFQIRPEVTTNVIFKNGKIQVAEGAPVVWMFNSYATDFIVDNVTVDCTNMAWNYGENCKVAVLRAEDKVQFTGNTKVENFNSEVAPIAYSVGGSMVIGENAVPGGVIKLEAGATLTAPAGLTVIAPNGHMVAYNNGVYTTIEVVATVGQTGYATLSDAVAAAQAGDEIEIVKAGSYKVPSGKNITITGAVDGVVFENIGAHNMGGASVKFNNVTFEYTADSTYKGLQHAGNLVYNDCTFNGQVFLYGEKETFNNCTFNNTGDNYNVWTYGAKAVEFNGCTFNSDGKSVLVYNEGATHFINVSVTDSTFNASAAVDGKAAIEIDTSLTAGATITVDEKTEATGFGTGNVSGNSLWNNKKGNEAKNNDITVTVANEVVLQPIKTASIGDIYYTTINAALAAAKDGDTITLLANIELSETLKVKGIVTLDLKGKTITGNDNATGNFALIEIQPGAELTIDNTSTDGSGKITLTAANNRGWNAYSSVISNQRGKLTVNGGTIEHLGGTDMAYGIDNLTNGKGTYAETVINGGTIKSPYRAIRQFLNGVEAQNILIVNGGTIEGDNKSIWMQDANASANPGTLTIKENAAVKGDVYLSVTADSTEWPVEINIANDAFVGESTVATSNIPDQYLVQDTNGVWGAVPNPAYGKVAQIGDTYYETLEDAFKAAVAGDTVTIFAGEYNQSLTVNTAITVVGETDAEGDKRVTLNGELSITADGATVKNLKVHNTGTACDVHAKDVLIENCELTGSNGLYQSYTSGTVTFKDSTITGNTYGIHFDGYAGGNIVIDNCIITGWTSFAASLTKITINESEFAAGNYNVLRFYQDAEVTNTTFPAGMRIDSGSGGTGMEGIVMEFNDCSVVDGSDFKECFPNGVVEKSEIVIDDQRFAFVAKIGETGYEAFDAAYNAANVGDTITLLAPIVVNAGETLTLDKDVTITYTSDVVGEDMITVRGNLNVEAGKITYINNSNGSNVTVSTISAEPGSVVNVTGGTIENMSVKADDSSSYPYAIDMLTNGSLGDVTVNISDGTVNSNYMAIRQFNNGEACKNSLNVTGGYIYGAKRAIQVHLKNNAAYTYISGGTIEGGDYSLCFLTTSENLNVTGGNFKGAVWYSGTDGFISGGTFDKAVDEAYIAEGFKVKDNGNGTFGVEVDPAYGKAAMIGETYFKTLAEAIVAAQNNDIVTLIKDIALADEPIGTLDGYPTYFKVEGKTITIDLNDKTISGNYTGATMLVGVFSTDNNGHLTLTGNGTVNVTATGTVYSLIANYEPGCSITIENGSYTLDKAGDSLIYSGADANENEGITVKDGTFTLGNVDTGSNGKPWIFNVLGSNDRHVNVSGGTYNFNISQQYWAHEVNIADAEGKLMAAKDNMNGTWSVVPAVAYISKMVGGYEYKIGYATLADAVNAADKDDVVSLLGDLNLGGGLMIGHSAAKVVTIDMNGYRLYTNGQTLTAFRSGTVVTLKNGTVHGNSTGGTLIATYGGKLILSDDLKVTSGGSATAIKIDNGKLEVPGKNVSVIGGKDCLNVSDNENNKLIISGGTYSEEIPEEWCIENYGSVKNSDGTWTVQQVKFVLNETTGEKYNTFADAISAIEKGADEQNLKLLGNVTSKGQFIGHSYAQKVTVDLNGFTMSATDKALTVYRGGTVVTLKNGTVSGNSTGGTIQVTYGGKLILGDDITVKAGGQATAIKLDNGTLITDGQNISVPTGKISIAVAATNTTIALNAGTYKTEIKPEWCAEGYKPVQNEDGTYSVVVDPAYGKEAMIGGTYFETLTEAIAAAQDNDIITVVNDITVGASDAGILDNSYNTFFKVEGKTITIDLNGKTITGDGAGLEKMLVGVFSTDNNGHLTLNDSIGTATVTMTANGAKVYALIVNYESGCSITINGGSYTLDTASDSLMYTGGDEGIIVNGGTFVLGNVGTGSNGMPWIFNALGSNDRNAVVNGGTFNFDVNHQFWAHEVVVPETLAVKANGDGTWTVVEAVAYVTEESKDYNRNVGYATLSDAFAAAGDMGYTVTLIKDIVLEESIAIADDKAVVLDLNGKAITGTDNATASFGLINIQPGAELTINDSSTDGSGKITLTATNNRGWNAYSSVISNQRGKLTVNGGTIEHLGGTDMAYGIDNLTNTGAQNAETVINGGTVKSTYRAIRQFLNSTTAQNILTVNGGTIEGTNKSIWMQDANASANPGSLTVSENAALTGDVYLSVAAGSTEWPVSVSIASAALKDGSEVLSANVPSGYVVDLVDGYYGVYNATVKLTSSVGNKYFETLAEAIETAQNSDTITLLTDIEVNEDDLVDLDGNHTFFKVDNKSITINLNSKTIYADASAVTDKFVVGVFSTTNGGQLTLTGNGTVQGYSGESQEAAYLDPAKGNTDYNYKFYTLLVAYNEGCLITVENGTYSLDYSGDSLIYSSCNEGVVVNGGTFTLGNLGGIRNGMPWTFNARGQNQRHVIVNGGSFCADIQHQYYPFEVQMSREKALKSENGMYTVVDAVAYVTEREWSSAWYTNEVGYATLEEAIAACEGPKTKVIGKNTYTSEQEVVVLLDNIVLEDTLVIDADKTVGIDLNGKTISQTKACTAHYEMIKNSGSLTIMDNVGEGKISFTDNGAGDPNFGWGSYTIGNYGTLVVKNGTVENLTSLNADQTVHMYSAIHQGWGAVSTTIDGGKISTPTYRSIRVNNGTLTINDGECDGQIWMQPFADGTSITINGGSFSPNGVDGSSVFVTNDSMNVNVSVTGGYFETKFGCSDASKLAGVITGGTFTDDAKANTNSALFAETFA